MPTVNKDGKYRWFRIDSCWVDLVIFVPYMQKLRNVSLNEAIRQFNAAVKAGKGFQQAVCVTPTGRQMINMSPGDIDLYQKVLREAKEQGIYTESHDVKHAEGWVVYHARKKN